MEFDKVPDHKNEFKKEDLEIIETFETEISSLRNLMDQQKLDESLKEIWIKISKSNKYIDEQALTTMVKSKSGFIETFIAEISMSEEEGYESDEERNKFMVETFCENSNINLKVFHASPIPLQIR